MKRRLMLAAAALAARPLAAQVPAWSTEAQLRLFGGPGLAERQRLVQQAESLLAQGDTAGAERGFEQAASTLHSADVEAGLVRTYMQAGEYRRALAFGAHAAGAHREVPAGSALYAWLLHVGGQGVVARRTLDDAIQSFPEDPLLRQAGEQLRQPWPRPFGRLLHAPTRCAPQTWGAGVPESARVSGTAVLAADGQRALAPGAGLGLARQVWLRNGLGQTVAAQVEARSGQDDDGWVVLRLQSPLPVSVGLTLAPRAPFAGSPGSLVEYAGDDSATPSWPLLRQGFFGRLLATPGERLLGIEAPPGRRGGPVFDAQGRWVGIARPGIDGRDRLAAADDLPLVLAPVSASAPVQQRASIDTVYESALRVTLQLMIQA
jgi:hypothetical protein